MREEGDGRNDGSGVLDVSNLPNECPSFDSIEKLRDALTSSGCGKYNCIVAQHDGLSSLVLSPSLTSAVQNVTSLTVSFNRISTLQGIEAFGNLEFLDLSNNALRVLDAHSTSLLRKLRYLKQCDFSFNEIHMIDFDTTLRSSNLHNEPTTGKDCGSSSATPTGAVEAAVPATLGFLEELIRLDLSHNRLTEVPDLRCARVLEELNLSHNRIDLIADIDNRLPLLRLFSLSISHNSLTNLQSLVPLTVLAGTLRALSVLGNPCVQEFASSPPVTGGIHAWLLWLLPHLELLDEAPLTAEERQIACKLFRRNNKLSYEVMDVMNTNNSLLLVSYLQKFTHVIASRSFAVAKQPIKGESPSSPSPKPAGSDGGNMGALQYGPVAVPSPASPPAATDGAARCVSVKPPTVELVVQMLQKKVKQLSNVMEVLWRESMARRVFAVQVLQKHARGFLVRRRLPQAVRQACRRIRASLRVVGRYTYFSNHKRGIKVDPVLAAVQPNSSVKTDSVETKYCGDARLIERLDDFGNALQRIQQELNEFRMISVRNKEKSATVIQKHYRGYLDRKRWRVLKESYDAFIGSLRQYVVELQRVSRGYLSRMRLAKDSRQSGEIRRLRAEVAELRSAVDEMRGVLQMCLQKRRHVDPECSLEQLMSRRLAPSSIAANGSTTDDSAILSAAATAAAAQAFAASRMSPEF